MSIYWFLFLVFGLILRGSQDSIEIPRTSSDSSEVDVTCDFALSRYYPDRNGSIVLRPYLRRILSETMSQHSPTREPIEQSPMHELVIRAAHHALEDKIKELTDRNNDLLVTQHRLQKKLSRKQAIGFSALCGLLSSVMTLVITIVSK